MVHQASRNVVPAKRINNSSNTSVIILNSMWGNRTKSYGPKGLFQIDNSFNLFERQMSILHKLLNKCEIICVIGFEHRKFINKKYPIRYVYNPVFEETNSSFELSLGLYSCVSPNILVINGDLVFDENIIKSATSKKESSLLISEDFEIDDVGVTYNENVEHIAYGLPEKWCQIGFFNGRELDLLRKCCYNQERSKWLLYESLNYVIQNGGKLHPIKVKNGKILKIETIGDLNKVDF